LLFDTMLDFVELNPGEFNFIFVPTSHPTCGGGGSVTTGGCGSGGCGGGGCASKGTTH
jgi:iron-sulfur cluster assembly protein